MRYVWGILLIVGTSTPLIAQDSVRKLQDVKTIYVDSFGNGESADLIRSKVSTELVKSNQFELVQTPEKADAILSGTRVGATAGVQLVNREQRILWLDNVPNGGFSRSASSSLAEKIVKNLLKVVSDAKKRSGSTKQR